MALLSEVSGFGFIMFFIVSDYDYKTIIGDYEEPSDASRRLCIAYALEKFGGKQLLTGSQGCDKEKATRDACMYAGIPYFTCY